MASWPRSIKITFLALIALKLVLLGAMKINALTNATHDDLLYVRQAANISAGQWLGPYDSLTLAKGPMYPLFIAFSHFIGVPLILSQQILYVLACLVVAAALRPAVNRWVVLLTFALLLYNPMSFHGGQLARVLRDLTYTAWTLITFASAMGLLLRHDWPAGRLWPWSLGLGISLSCFWLTREEGIWIVASLALLLLCAAWKMWRSRAGNRYLRLGAVAVPVLMCIMACTTICMINKVKYGVFATCEFKAAPFLDAYGALARVKHERFAPHVPVPKEVRLKIYPLSPAFRELQPLLEGAVGQIWVTNAAGSLPGLNGEIGPWFIWALRHAVEESGHATSGTEAMAYYRRLAAEVNAACDSGKLAALPRRSTLQPPWDWRYLPSVLADFSSARRKLVRFEGFTSDVPRSQGDPVGMQWFREVTRSPLATLDPPVTQVSGWAFAPAADIDLRVIMSDGRPVSSTLRWLDSAWLEQGYRSKGINVPRAAHAVFELSYPETSGALLSVQAGGKILRLVPLDGQHPTVSQPDLQLQINLIRLDADDFDVNAMKQTRLSMLNGIGAAYKAIVPVIVWAALAALVVQTAALFRRRRSIWLPITVPLLIAVLARLGLLALIDATSFPTIAINYLVPLYPLLLLFCVLALMDAADALRQFRATRRGAAREAVSQA